MRAERWLVFFIVGILHALVVMMALRLSRAPTAAFERMGRPGPVYAQVEDTVQEPDTAPRPNPMNLSIRRPTPIQAPAILPIITTASPVSPASTDVAGTSTAPSGALSTGGPGQGGGQPPSYDADYLANPAPEYPQQARRLRQQGLTSLRVHVSAAGLPDEIEIEESSGYEALDEAAVAAVWQWRFEPARIGSRAVPGWVIVPLRFTLKSRGR